MDIQIASGSIAEQRADALLVSADRDKRLDDSGQQIDRALNGELSRALEDLGFRGTIGSTAVVSTLGHLEARRVVVTGTGSSDGTTLDDVRRAWAAGARAARKAGARSIVSGPVPSIGAGAAAYRAAAEGVLLALYRFLSFRTVDLPTTDVAALTFLNAPDAAAGAIRDGEQIAAGVYAARDLVNRPGLDLYPERLAGAAWEMAEQFGLEVTSYDRGDLVDMEAGGIVAVGQGSSREPRLIHLVYRPDGESRGSAGFVGKAITFDTGGVNLKTAEGMSRMKMDMAGGAAVFGAMRMVAALKPSFTVHGVIAAAENMPSGTAYRPGDVLRTLSGKTVEITNTDAEGRIVLADALTYTARQNVDLMIDLATLTGASMVAVGAEASSVFGNDERLIQDVLAASQEAGERMWHMPLWDDYRRDLDSDVADIKNSGGRDGGAIKAALFLKEFTHGVPWVHLDIAGPAWSNKETGYLTKGGTGHGARTLVSLLERRATAEAADGSH
jgi:leucyl aminopeptidase